MAEKKQTYQWIWRWHFYAGVIFAPFLLVLALTGAVYLFKAEIEQAMYKPYYQASPPGEAMPANHLIEAAKAAYPDAAVTRYRPADSPDRTAEVGLSNNGEAMTVFVDPYTMRVAGTLPDSERIMDKIEKIHGELMMSTLGDRIVELAACWAVILLLTGLFLWWPRGKKSLKGVLWPRFSGGKTTLIRDLHAVPAFWLSAGMLFLIMTGLPWSGFWGTQVQNAATNSGAGYPPAIWVGAAPLSDMRAEDVADVGWAAENLPVPKSIETKAVAISVDDALSVIEERNVQPGFDLYIPQEETGVFTVSSFPAKAENEITMYLDQYSGRVLADYRYGDYGPIGKTIALGITLHKGSQFGMVNKLIGLAICLGLIATIATGLLLWRKRKHSPPARPSGRVARSVIALMVLLGFLFPLAGASMLIVWGIDQLVKAVKR